MHDDIKLLQGGYVINTKKIKIHNYVVGNGTFVEFHNTIKKQLIPFLGTKKSCNS